MSASSSLAWTCELPPFLTEPYRLYKNGTTASKRLAHGIALFDALGRTLVAVFASAVADPRAVRGFKDLRLDKPTLGQWWDAARQLAPGASGPPGPVTEAAAAVRDPRTQAAVGRLIALRNGIAHAANGAIVLTEDDAASKLGEAARDFDHVVDAFAPLGGARVFWERSRKNRSGRLVVELVQFTGRDATTRPVTIDRLDVDSEQAFLLEPTGRALGLGGFVRVFEDHEPKVGLLAHTGCYTVGLEPRKVDEPGRDVLDGLRSYPNMLPAAEAARLCAVARTDAPVVPGVVIEGLLGTGATASVWRGRDQATQSPVAVKVLRPELAADGTAKARLEREIQQGIRLRHPNLVRTLRVTTTEDGRSAVLQEWVDGLPLDEHLRGADRTSALEVIRIGRELARALSHLHAHHVIHRDVKPSNVMLDRDGHIRLIDLGLASARDGQHLTRTSEGNGTIGYSAPEQLRGAAADPRADVFAAGTVLDELARRLDRVPDGLHAVLRRAIQDDPADRYASGGELLAALEQTDLLDGVCPVGLGDRLGDSFSVVKRGQVVPGHPDVWHTMVKDSRNQGWFVILTRSTDPASWVAAVASRSNVPLEQTRDGIQWVRVREDVLQKLLVAEKAAARAAPRTPPPAGDGNANAALAGAATGLAVVAAGAALGAATVAQFAGLGLRAALAAKKNRKPR